MNEIIEMVEDENGVWENHPDTETQLSVRITQQDPTRPRSSLEKGDFVTVLGYALGRSRHRSIIAKPYLSPFYSYMFNTDIQLTSYFPSDATKPEEIERVKWFFLDAPEKQGEGSLQDLIVWMTQNDVRVFIGVDGDFIDMKPYPEENPVTLQAYENDAEARKIMKLSPYSF